MAQTDCMPLCRWTTISPMCLCPGRDTSVPWQDGMPSINACHQVHQLQVWKLLQHRSWVVCHEGLNWELEAMQFTFEELPLWDVAAMDEPTPGPISDRVGPHQCPAQQCDNHHSGSHYHTGATPFSSCHHWTFLQYHCGHQPAAPGDLEATAMGFPHYLDPSLPAQYAEERAAISRPWGLCHQVKWQRVPLTHGAMESQLHASRVHLNALISCILVAGVSAR